MADLDPSSGDALHAFSHCAGACHLMAVGLQRGFQNPQDRRFIVDDESPDFGAHTGVPSRGKVRMKRAPPPVCRTLRADRAAMCLHDAFGNGEAETGTMQNLFMKKLARARVAHRLSASVR